MLMRAAGKLWSPGGLVTINLPGDNAATRGGRLAPVPMFRPICQPSSQLWRFAAVLLVVFALTAGRADADPIHVAVGSTTDVLVPANAEIVFDLLGGGTRLRGMAFGEESEDLLIVTPPGPDPLVTGASADLSSTSTFSMGFGTLGTQEVRWAGEMTFAAPGATLACTGSGDAMTCTGAAAFQFTGLLHAFDATSDAPLRDLQLAGQGRANGVFNPEVPRRVLSFGYTFQSAPVPEPSTLVLVGTMVAGAVARRRSARLRRHQK